MKLRLPETRLGRLSALDCKRPTKHQESCGIREPVNLGTCARPTWSRIRSVGVRQERRVVVGPAVSPHPARCNRKLKWPIRRARGTACKTNVVRGLSVVTVTPAAFVVERNRWSCEPSPTSMPTTSVAQYRITAGVASAGVAADRTNWNADRPKPPHTQMPDPHVVIAPGVRHGGWCRCRCGLLGRCLGRGQKQRGNNRRETHKSSPVHRSFHRSLHKMWRQSLATRPGIGPIL
jgi:hypothetical protein